MKKASALSVRAQLAVLAAVFVLPAAGIIVWSGVRAREDKIQEALAETQKFAAAIVAVHESRVAAAEQLMTALGKLPAVKNRDAALQPMLRDILRLNPDYYFNISVADANGNVWASAVPATNFTIADRRHFRNAIATGRLSSGEYVTSRAGSRPAFFFAYAFRDERGAIAGVISVGFDLLSYARLLESSRLPPRSSFAFIDHRGTIVARAIDPAPYVGRPLETQLFQSMLNGPEEETSIGTSLTGEQRVRTYRKLRLSGEDEPYMYLRAGMPFSGVIAGANRALARNIALLLSCVLVALAFAWVIAKWTIVDRIALLESASRSVADGDLGVRVGDLVRGGELGRLGCSFDRMAEQLALREKALQESERKLLQAQKMEAVGRLAGGVAHDFNNILTVILGAADEMLGRSSRTDAQSRELTLEVKDAAQRAAVLTRQLLAFSRQQPLQPRVIDLNEVIANVEKLLQRLIGEDIVISTCLEPALGLVRADPGQIEQVLMNLVVNARDAMPHGGRLTIETSNVERAVPDGSPKDAAPTPYVRMLVSDTGSGMPPEVLEHAFEPFFTTKERGRGTGLGLSTVLGIVAQSGGNISVSSEPGKGTTFKVFLPRIAGASEAPSNPGDFAPVVVQGTETVLVVEDDARVRAFMVRSLRAAGHDILEAEGPAEAERIAREHSRRIDLLVSDVVMPVMDGVELAARLARLRPELRVLFVSGYTDNDALRRGALPPGHAFLPKPFTERELIRAAHLLLDHCKSSDDTSQPVADAGGTSRCADCADGSGASNAFQPRQRPMVP
jgi:signal transduction histidine kinase/CheY-like chemotaxis protein